MDLQERENGSTTIKSMPKILISGASFAGLASAWWMNRLGYRVTIVEIANSLRKGGTPVDIREGVIDVVRRMGLLDRIAANGLPPRSIEFLRADGTMVARIPAQRQEIEDGNPGWEIERNTLLDMLFDEVKEDTEFLFGDSIAAVEETSEEVKITFASGRQDSYSLLLGCDGTHSAVRRMCFGEESAYLLFLRNYFALSIVNKLLIEENTSNMVNVPGKTTMLNAYNGKTDIGFGFSSADEVAYDRRNQEQQKQIILERFKGDGWRTQELLDEMSRADNFYFDKLCQIRMDSWSKGRVVLVGDAAYCPSPAAGMGGSMALLGAAALADAFASHPDDFRMAFKEYDERLRPTVEAIQTDAIETSLKMVAPVTEEDIRQRDAQLSGS